MIALRPLQSINLLSLFAKRVSSYEYNIFSSKRRISSSSSHQLMMAAKNDVDADNVSSKNYGRIWLHRPFQNTPTLMTSDKCTITRCPLPKSTPHTSREDKLHTAYYSSPTPEKLLQQIYKSKVDFYESQFNSRVDKEAHARIERRTIESPSGWGKVDATIYLPEGTDESYTSSKLQGICLHTHGGGLVWGDSYHQVAHRCLEMSQSMNIAVVSVEYSLVTRVNRHSNAFDPVNDVSIAIDWIESNGAKELNTYPSFVASGESSGAHILMLAMLKRRDRDNVTLHPPLPLPPTITQSSISQSTPFLSCWKCLNLVYPVCDISGTPSLLADGDSSSPLCGNDLLWMYDLCYSKVQETIQHVKVDRRHPSLSPLYANLSHLPPVLISVGTADPLLDDSIFLANKYSAYGNHVELAIYEGGEHGIGHFGLQEEEEMGIRARGHTLGFLREHLAK